MSQVAAMKVSRFLPKKTHNTRNNDAFTLCGISLISPNTLHLKHSGGFNVLAQLLFHFFGLVFRTENDTYTEFVSLKLEWGYGKWWCNVGWCVCAVAWNVERCAIWNEAECRLWHGMWNVVRYGMRQSVGCGMECGKLCDMERGRVWAVAWNVESCAMWNEVDGVCAVAWNVERCAMWNEVEFGL